MKTISLLPSSLRRGLSTALLGTLPFFASAGIPALVDGFDEATVTSLGTARILVNDATAGGQSKADLTYADGVLTVRGELAPGRGQPAFVSLVLLLSPQGEAQDLSAYEGIRLRVRVTEGNLSVLAASSEIQNYDYHTAPLTRTRGEFKEVKIPFADLRRLWSAQTPLNLETITSLNLVASGMQAGTFAYEVDEIGLY